MKQAVKNLMKEDDPVDSLDIDEDEFYDQPIVTMKEEEDSSTTIIIIVVVMVLLLCSSSGVGFYLMKKK